MLKRTGERLDREAIWKAVGEAHATLHVREEDHGSIDKLLHALRMEFDLILTLDDDMIYSPELVRDLLAYSEEFPESALCYRGKIIEPGKSYRRTTLLEGKCGGRRQRGVRQSKGEPVDIITGVWGALYRREWFDYDTLLERSRRFPSTDDIVISSLLAELGIEKRLVELKAERPFAMPTCRINELFKINRHNSGYGTPNDRAIAELFSSSIASDSDLV